MKRNRTIAIVSTSTLAAGMAQGAVVYSGLLNIQIPCPPDTAVAPAHIDMNGDFVTDFEVGYDGFGSSNWRKPFVDTRLYSSSVALTQPDSGVPVTPFGVMIDADYLEPSPTRKGYLSQNGDGHLVGEWPQTAATEGYVGVILYDSGNSTTNFGWIHMIYDATVNPPNLTLVDWAYETTPGLGIPAGSTNTLGAPQIYELPQSQSLPIGATLEMNVLALGKPSPTYQWRSGAIGSGTYTDLVDGGNISGATTPVLKIDGAAPADARDYVVVVANSLGSVTTAPPASLTLSPPIVSPAVQRLFSGVTARFKVDIGSGLSPTYQWRKNGGNLANGGKISGANTAELQISAVAPVDAGNYDVVVTIGSTPNTSAAGSLAVLPVESTYEAALLAAGPTAYYPLNETGNPAAGNLPVYDNVGAFNGRYGAEAGNAFTSVAGPNAADGFPGFRSGNAAALFTPYMPDSRVVVAPWNLNTDTLTLTAWLNPGDDQFGSAGIIYTISSNKMNAGLSYYYQRNTDTGLYSIAYNWHDDMDIFWDPGFSPPARQWSFVALVVRPTSGAIYIFNSSGLTFAVNDGLSPRAPLPFNVPQYIGTDPTSTSGSQNFNGIIDEVAVFNKALTQAELQTLYNAALGIVPPVVTLDVKRAGDNIELTWSMGRLLEATSIAGPWTTNSAAASPYLVTPTGPQKFYRVMAD
jgi:hypothetical protein